MRVLVPTAGFVAGLSLLLGALSSVDWTYPELAYRPGVIPMVASGLGIVCVGWAWHSSWRKAALLLLLLLVGQASALQLIDAPRYAVYQHYQAWRDLGAAGPWIWVLTFQLVLCLSLLLRSAGWVFRKIRNRAGVWRLAIMVAVVVFMAAVPTVGFGRYLGETLLAVLVMSAGLLNLVLIAIHVPAGGMERVDDWLSERLRLAPHHETPGRWERRFVWVMACVTIMVTAGVSLLVFEGVPHIQDSVAYLFQARTFAQGHLYLPSPPDPEAFAMTHIVDDGTRWYSKYLPGWPAMLSIGVFAGVPWLVNPLVAGLTVMAVHALLKRLYAPWFAHTAVVLIVVSPWFLFMSGSQMSHPVSLLWTVLALLAVERERARRSGAWAAVAGLCLAAIFLTRPLEAFLVAPVVLVWGVFGNGGSPWRLRSVLACLAAGSVVSVIIFPYNQVLTGNALLTPFTLWSNLNYGPGVDVLGFGPGVGIRDWPNIDPIPGHGIVDVVLNLNKNMFMTNIELFGWSAGSLLIGLVALFLWRWRGADLMFLALAAVVVLGHSVYWFSGGPDLGARYWYLTLVPLLVITVRGIQLLATDRNGVYERVRYRRVGSAILAAVLSACVTFVPWRAWDKHYRYRDIGRDGPALVAGQAPAGSLVLVRSDRSADYEAVFNSNPVDLHGRQTVIARDTGPEGREALRAEFPERPVYLMERVPGESRLQWKGRYDEQ
jgi:hypothetical protein